MSLSRLSASALVFILVGLFIGPALWRMALEIQGTSVPVLLPVYLHRLSPFWTLSGWTSVPNIVCICFGVLASIIRYRKAAPFVFSGAKLFWFLLACLAGAFNFVFDFFGWLYRTHFYGSYEKFIGPIFDILLPWGYLTGYVPLFFDVTFSVLIWTLPLFIIYRFFLKDKVISI